MTQLVHRIADVRAFELSKTWGAVVTTCCGRRCDALPSSDGVTVDAEIATCRLPSTAGELGTCRTCGTRVRFVPQPSGKTPPYDVDDAGELVRDDRGRAVSHFATCPQAAAWRGKAKR